MTRAEEKFILETVTEWRDEMRVRRRARERREDQRRFEEALSRRHGYPISRQRRQS